jgi:pimeloyl-ACP methyl ester carboxylesterase
MLWREARADVAIPQMRIPSSARKMAIPASFTQDWPMKRWFAAILLVLADTAAAAGNIPTQSGSGQLYNVNGVQLFVEMSGKGSPILFLHGGLSYFDEAFAAQKAYFATFRTVIGVDQRGHGHSPDIDQAFSYRQMAEDTAALLQQLKVGRVDVVGHSDGGNVGLLMARYHPELVRRLVISGANSRGDYDGLLAYLRFRFSSEERFAVGVPASARDLYVRVSPDGVQHWPTIVAKTKALWATRVVIDAADLAAIHIPVLVMTGDHDVIPIEHTVELYRQLPRAQLCILPATGHATMQDRPDEFDRLTREFLEDARIP